MTWQKTFTTGQENNNGHARTNIMVRYPIDTFLDNTGGVAIEQTKKNSKSVDGAGTCLCSVIHVLSSKSGNMFQRRHGAMTRKNKKARHANKSYT